MSDMYFKGLPDKSTPLIPSNLDKLNDIKVSPTEPTTNEKVWIQKGKNLLNKNTSIVNKYIEATGEILDSTTSSLSDFIPVKNETNYTISYGTITEYYKSVNFYKNDKTLIRCFNVMNNNTTTTITTPENCAYIRFHYITENQNVVQLEVGKTATEYEAYIEKKIYCKNDNGVFEEFVNAEENKPINITTGVEFETGRIIDGKKEYGKRIDCGAMPNATQKAVQTGITDIGTITQPILGNAKTSTTPATQIPLPYLDGAGNNIAAWCYGTSIYLQTNYNHSAFSGYVDLYYTKTT